MTGRRPDGPSLPDPDFCHYATGIFLPLLMELEGELQGVVRDDDIEYVHRCRVATRRIRAAFSLFSGCFPPRLLRKYTKEIRRLTRSLGEARDLDVQIGFVQSFLDETVSKRSQSTGLFSPSDLVPHADASQTKTAAIMVPGETSTTKPVPLRSRITHWLADHHLLAQEEKQFIIPSGPSSADADEYALFHQSDPVVAGLECLLLRLVQKRRVMQPGVAAIVTDCQERGMIQDMTRFLHDLKIRSMLRGTGTHSVYSYEQAFLHSMVRIADLFWFEPYLSDPSLIHRHHEMRIAAKRLRYTLEAYAHLYEGHLRSEIKAIKKVQEFLGDLHDCDVWIEYLPVFLTEEEERSVAYFGNHRFFRQIKPGISLLTDDRRETRGRLFDEFCRYWEDLKDKGFWDTLSEKISVPVQNSFSGAPGAGPVAIAVISDVHANLPALEAVLADAEERGVAVVLNAGDMIGYGPFPDEVVSLIRSRHILSVVGNYDLSVISKRWKTGKVRSREKQVAMRWAYHNLSHENRVWLKSLSHEIRLPVRGVRLLVTHGSPDSITEYLDDGTPETRLLEIASGLGVRVVVSGHSHRPAAREVGGVWFVNPGSVGRSEDGDPRACYALITVDPFSLTHIRIPYDVERTVSAIRERHLPDSFARIVREGRPLEMVQNG